MINVPEKINSLEHILHVLKEHKIDNLINFSEKITSLESVLNLLKELHGMDNLISSKEGQLNRVIKLHNYIGRKYADKSRKYWNEVERNGWKGGVPARYFADDTIYESYQHWNKRFMTFDRKVNDLKKQIVNLKGARANMF